MIVYAHDFLCYCYSCPLSHHRAGQLKGAIPLIPTLCQVYITFITLTQHNYIADVCNAATLTESDHIVQVYVPHML
jgi:hypothetical protein